MKHLSLDRRNQHERAGTTSVEMALVLPIFLAFVFGCMEFSQLSLVRSQGANAAYEGARFAMVQGSTEADAQQAVADNLELLGIEGATTEVNFLDESESPTAPGQATRINVQVNIPYSQNGFLLPYLPDALYETVLTSQVTLRTNVHESN